MVIFNAAIFAMIFNFRVSDSAVEFDDGKLHIKVAKQSLQFQCTLNIHEAKCASHVSLKMEDFGICLNAGIEFDGLRASQLLRFNVQMNIERFGIVWSWCR